MAESKLSHAQVKYSHGHGSEFCHNCKYSDHKAEPTCRFVVDIDTYGWCILWKETGHGR